MILQIRVDRDKRVELLLDGSEQSSISKACEARIHDAAYFMIHQMAGQSPR
ncbi:MAG: hypothetical protein O3A92_02760 [Verrucomicrobia bacterium]|nr:hypothetical protein [Verrucomicrobiota bacterium]